MGKPFKLPLAGGYNTRMVVGAAAPAASGIVGIGIVGLMIVGAAQSVSRDANYANCFVQTVNDPVYGRKRIYIVKRPGFATGFTPWAGHIGNALLVWTGSASGTDLISSFGETNSNIYNGDTLLGAITGVTTGITESAVGANVATIAITSTDQTGWYYDVATGVPTKIMDADFPGNAGKLLAGTFAHLKGFVLILTKDGFLYAGDINTMTGWTSNSFDSANTSPDKGVALLTHKEFVVALGAESVEFWYNAGLTPFPLARASAKTLKIGAVSADAIGQISDTFWWCGSTPQGGLQIFQYDGSLAPVSTPEINYLLTLAGASNISLTTLRFYGRSFVLVRAGPTTKTYCVEEKFWFDWTSETQLIYKWAGISQGATMVNYAVSNVSTSGKVYAMNHATLVFDDDGAAYTARIQTAKEDHGTSKTKFYPYLDIVGDTEASTSILTISKTDNDYQTIEVLGTVDLSLPSKRITRLGSAKERAWIFTNASNTPMRLERAEGELELGN